MAAQFPTIDWNLVVRLGAAGVLIGVLLGSGVVPLRFAFPLWLAVSFAWGLTIARAAPRIPWRTALMVGLLAGFLAGDVEALVFYDDYEPRIREAVFGNTEPEPSGNGTENGTADPTVPTRIPRMGIVLGGIVDGIRYGLLAGLGAWVVARVTKRAEAEAAAAEAEAMAAEETGEEE